MDVGKATDKAWHVVGSYDGQTGHLYFCWVGSSENDQWGERLEVVYLDRMVGEITSKTVLGDWDAIIGCFYLGLLSALGSDSARESLRDRLDHPNVAVRLAARQAEAMLEPAYLFRRRVENFRYH